MTNILFAIADDASHMSAYGHQFLRTPNFDRVAAEGVRFTRAYTTNPKCAPSRASILTGRHTWQLEEGCCHYGYFPSGFSVYPSLLADAGYHVGHTGKGWAPGDFARAGFTDNPAGPAFQERTLTAPSPSISSRDYAANFADFLEARPEGTPFCFWYGGHEPHRPYHPGQGVAAGKELADMTVPGYLPQDDTVRSDLADYAVEVEWFDAQLGKMLDLLEARGELDDTLVVVTSDNGMPFPRVKGQMYEDDFNLPLAARWGARVPGGRVVHDFVSFADFAPTFLEAAGAPVHVQMSGRSLVDVLTAEADGQVDPSRDTAFMGRERHDLGREGDLGYPVRVVRRGDWLYALNCAPDRWPSGSPETGYTNIDSSPTKTLILEQHDEGDDRYYDLAMAKRPEEELYNVVADRACLHNLAGASIYAELKAELRELLESSLREQGDPRFCGDPDHFEEMDYVGADTHSWRAREEGRWQPQPY
jgi:arylsulfatase A-like enzyme